MGNRYGYPRIFLRVFARLARVTLFAKIGFPAGTAETDWYGELGNHTLDGDANADDADEFLVGVIPATTRWSKAPARTGTPSSRAGGRTG